ncbi:PDZ domain-containing protein [Rhizobium sp. F40D2]|uniref:PDZ domain-containing protein n=1 Tax=Rhizobium sp. F40D2 TaxID=3453141 RepID=UPI003F2305CC
MVVTDDTTAARAGLQPDDMIIALDRKPVSDIEGVVSLLAQEELRSLVTIRRSNHQFFMALDTQTQ